MSIEPGMISAVHHLGLPSYAKDWPSIREFWEGLDQLSFNYQHQTT